MAKEVLNNTYPTGVNSALLAFPAASQQKMAAALLESLGPLMDTIVPIMHASAAAVTNPV